MAGPDRANVSACVWWRDYCWLGQHTLFCPLAAHFFEAVLQPMAQNAYRLGLRRVPEASSTISWLWGRRRGVGAGRGARGASGRRSALAAARACVGAQGCMGREFKGGGWFDSSWFAGMTGAPWRGRAAAGAPRRVVAADAAGRQLLRRAQAVSMPLCGMARGSWPVPAVRLWVYPLCSAQSLTLAADAAASTTGGGGGGGCGAGTSVSGVHGCDWGAAAHVQAESGSVRIGCMLSMSGTPPRSSSCGGP